MALPIPPDQIFLHRENQLSLFRWPLTKRAYAATIPLVSSAAQVVYSSNLHRIFLGTEAGRIDQIKLDEGFRSEGFANSPQRLLGLAAAGEHLMVCDAAGPWVTHYTYDAAGTRLASRDWNHYSRSYEWSPT